MTRYYTQKDGGQAFPRAGAQTNAGWSRPVAGMTLRDWFAGQALVGLVAGYHANSDMGGVSPSMWAEGAYQYADAMLAQREKHNE
jgi:hypothetical protein